MPISKFKEVRDKGYFPVYCVKCKKELHPLSGKIRCSDCSRVEIEVETELPEGRDPVKWKIGIQPGSFVWVEIPGQERRWIAPWNFADIQKVLDEIPDSEKP